MIKYIYIHRWLKYLSQLFVATILMIYGANNCWAWPTVTPTSGSIDFKDASSAEFTKNIKDFVDDRVRYVFRCKSGELDDDADFNYSGLFHCRLYEPNAPREESHSLLFENRQATSDWDGRARFLLNEVVGACAQYPDWGASREYYVRGMKIHLKVDKVIINPDDRSKARSFRFLYRISASDTASTALTRASPLKEPKWFGGGDQCLQSQPSAVHK